MNNKDVYQAIFEEFNKTQNDIKQDVNILKKWYKEQPHFPPEMPSENLLRNYLIHNKFSIERAKSRLDMYYSIRNMMPEIFGYHPLDRKIVHHRKVVIAVPFPKLFNNFEQIFCIRLNNEFGPEEFYDENLLIQIIHLNELCLQEKPVLKYHFIFDAYGLTLAHTLRVSIMNVKKFTIFHEKVYGLRVGSMHYINLSPILNTFATSLTKFLPQKLQTRLIISQDDKEIIAKFGKSILPKDYGGEVISLAENNENLTKKYEEKKSFYDNIQQMKSNENLRPESLKNDDILGYYGTFKNINVD